MAEENDSAEKTQDPTPKRREDARADGQVLTARDVFTFTTMVTGLAILTLSQGPMAMGLGQWGQSFTWEAGTDLNALIMARLGDAMAIMFWLCALIGLPIVAMIIATQAAMGGIIFAPKAFGFKPEKIDPLKGLARMFSVKSLVELGKSILKLVALLGAAWMAIAGMIPELSQIGAMELGAGLSLFFRALLRVMAALCVALALIAAIDFAWQAYDFGQKLKMSIQDIKDEMKQQEGAPELKAQIRRRQYQAAARAKERAALADVPRATAIVTNPAHFAIALRYIPGETSAPVILAMGRDTMAAEIREIARRARIARISAPPLARALYFTGQIGQAIPVGLYGAVATILAHIWRLEQGLHEEMPALDLPPELQFDSYGRPAKRKGAQ